MTEDQQQNLDSIIDSMLPAIEDKYYRGTQEHSGNLADMPTSVLKQELLNELFDLFVYMGELKRRGEL